MDFKQRLQRFQRRYQQFVEKQGFPIIMTACIAVIVLTAVWSGRMDETLPVPTPPVDLAQSAARLQQESLADATTPVPSPSPAPTAWSQPLPALTVQRSFDSARMVRSAVTGIWQVHDAVDLKADIGHPVSALGSGTVVACMDEGVMGACVTIDHGEITALYAGMAQLAALKTGDPVSAGQTIGFVGEGPLDEQDQGPHLHLRVSRGGQSIDPLLLFPLPVT